MAIIKAENGGASESAACASGVRLTHGSLVTNSVCMWLYWPNQTEATITRLLWQDTQQCWHWFATETASTTLIFEFQTGAWAHATWEKTSAFSSAGWYHLLLSYTCGNGSDTDAVANAWINGSPVTWSTTPSTTDVGYDNSSHTITMCDPNNWLQEHRLAHIAMWHDQSDRFTDAEASVLYADGTMLYGAPLQVDPDKLVHYWPCQEGADGVAIATTGDEIKDVVGGDHANSQSGTYPEWSADPTVVANPLGQVITVAGAAPADAMPMAMHHYRQRRAG